MSYLTSLESALASDPEILNGVLHEKIRQQNGLEMIASENYTSMAVMAAQGSILTNKYAEGYPGKRYYGGCEIVDQIETLAIERAKKLFGAEFANVQPHSGSQANQAVFFALLNPGDRILGMDLSHGGHLTHGSPANMSGAWFQAKAYGLDPETGLLNMDSVRKIALEWKPKLIIAGYSAYPRKLDFAQFRSIADEVGAQLLVDMAHFAGLVAAGYHDNPFPHAHYVTSTTHKTLRGPRGGIILTNSEDLAKKMNSRIFPGLQGGPLEHVIAGKAVAFGEALKPEFKIYIKNVIENSQAIAERLKKNNLNLVTDGTDNHLVLIDLSQLPVSGKEAEAALGRAGITVNKNTVPNEKRSPFVTSGIRIGTPALTSRGMGKSEMMLIGDWISQIILSPADEIMQNKIRISVQEMTAKFPIYS